MVHGGLVYGILGIALLAVVTTRTPSPVSSQPEPPPIAAAANEDPARPAGYHSGRFATERSSDGHFYVEARVNGAPVRFLIDTGATMVVLTAEDGRRAGIGAGEASARAIGAGGEVALQPVALARLALGPVVADQVPAMVAGEDALPVSLLGQSYLARFASVSIEGDTLTLR